MLKPTQIYIDLGTANTLIYVNGRGFVLNEASSLTLRTHSHGQRELFALGTPSKQMLGKEPPHIQVHRPLREGVIADLDLTTLMLEGFLARAKAAYRWIRPEITISLPCRVTRPERTAVEETARALGARKMTLIEEPVAAAIGAKLPILSPQGSMVVDIGGGTTEIAVIACGGIIHSNAVRVAGNHFDGHIIRFIQEKYQFLIGELTAERLKMALGTALPAQESEKVEVGGRDLRSGLPRLQTVTADDIHQAIQPALQEILGAIKVALNDIPPEVVSDLLAQGMILTGGGSLIRNLDQLIENQTGIKAKSCGSPLHSIALGGARAIQNQELLERIAI